MSANERMRIVRLVFFASLLLLVAGAFLGDSAHGQSGEDESGEGTPAEGTEETPPPPEPNVYDQERLGKALNVGADATLPQEEGTPAPALEAPAIEAKPTPAEERATYLDAKLRRLQEEQKRLETLQEDVKADLAKLEKLKVEIDQRLAQEDEITQQKVAKLVDIYNRMDLDKLVKVLQQQPPELRINLLYRMKEKRVSEILQMMDPEAAAEISRQLLNKKTK